MGNKKILVANVGSTSFKYQLFDAQGLKEMARGKIERINTGKAELIHSCGTEHVQRDLGACSYAQAIEASLEALRSSKGAVISSLEDIAAVGFKTVHAGPMSGSFMVDEPLIRAMEEYSAAVPAHNPPYIEAIKLFQQIAPGTPLVAVFETAFHRGMPDYAKIYSLPYEWYSEFHIRKYGFHGASHRYVTEKAAEILAAPLHSLRIISCHLGGSSSICAVKNGVSVDTSMGFSPQSGLPMSSRNGDIDPFIIFYLLEEKNLDLETIKQSLIDNSGLKGISGISGDLRDLEEAAAHSERARLALDVFAYEVKKYIGAYTAVLEGLDALIFTGGIGENSVFLRQKICQGLEFLGIELDSQRNQVQGSLSTISPERAPLPLLVIPTNEELVVARETLRVLHG